MDGHIAVNYSRQVISECFFVDSVPTNKRLGCACLVLIDGNDIRTAFAPVVLALIGVGGEQPRAVAAAAMRNQRVNELHREQRGRERWHGRARARVCVYVCVCVCVCVAYLAFSAVINSSIWYGRRGLGRLVCPA